jgi:hypothetical protein
MQSATSLSGSQSKLRTDDMNQINSSPTNSSRIPAVVLPGLMLFSAATLVLEIGMTRILSVTLWYPFAFMAVSTALFGFGFAGIALSFRKNAASISDRLLVLCSLATPVSFVFGTWLFHRIEVEPYSLAGEPVQWVLLPLSYLSLMMPFFFSGLTISALFTRYAAQVHRLYFFDLVGAALGSLLVAALLGCFGGSGTVFFASGLAALGAWWIVGKGRVWKWVAAGMALLLLSAAPWGDRILPVRISRDKVSGGGIPLEKLLKDPKANLFTAWNSLSRIDVLEWKGRRTILIDAGTAVTRLAHPDRALDELGRTDDEEAFFFKLFKDPSVLVVGSGGGREVLIALRNGAGKITGVEINPAIQDLVTNRMADFTGRLYQHPKVKAVTDEARSFLRRSRERYEVIYCPHTISNAAMQSGAMSLVENHLMTLEAFSDFFAHLALDGVLVITRPEAQLPRLFSTVRSLYPAEIGSKLSQRVMAWRQPSMGSSFYSGVAVRMRPFSDDEITAFSETIKKRGLEPLYLPGKTEPEPYHSLLTASAEKFLDLSSTVLLEPATDDRPFFNQRILLSKIRWKDVWGIFSGGQDARMALEDRPVAEAALVVLLLQAAALALVFIVLPLVVFRRRSLDGKGRVRLLLAATALGMAYIIVEVGFIQRFTLFLGKPVVVFSVVLGTLLCSSGLGSAFSIRFRSEKASGMAGFSAALMGAVVCFLTPPVVEATLAWPEWARVLVCVLLLAPPGFVMGMPFPLMIRSVEKRHPERIPWCWGVNGFGSVVGSILAVLLGMGMGYTAVLLAGVFCYVVAALSLVSKSVSCVPTPD